MCAVVKALFYSQSNVFSAQMCSPIQWCFQWQTHCRDHFMLTANGKVFNQFCSYDVKLDFKDHKDVATIKLEWKHAQDAAAFTVIPTGRLVHRFV